MKIAIILVNYNGERYNVACIESILKNQGEYEVDIIVVDNASTDQSLSILQETYLQEQVEVICLSDNIGFAGANNVGIRRAEEIGADYVLLLNNDTEIASDMIQQLITCAGHYPDSVIAPKIYYSDDRNRIWAAGGSVSPIIKKVSHDGLNQIDRGQFNEEKEIEFATGCCLFIPMAVIERTGVLDERFFLYYEDTEYSFRLQKQGVHIYYCPKAYMYHKVGASSKGADSPLCVYYISRNWLICAHQYLKGLRYIIFLAYYGVNRVVCGLVWLVGGKLDLVKALWIGVKDYRAGVTGKTQYY